MFNRLRMQKANQFQVKSLFSFFFWSSIHSGTITVPISGEDFFVLSSLESDRKTVPIVGEDLFLFLFFGFFTEFGCKNGSNFRRKSFEFWPQTPITAPPTTKIQQNSTLRLHQLRTSSRRTSNEPKHQKISIAEKKMQYQRKKSTTGLFKQKPITQKNINNTL